jgi:hypothetical protein
MAQDNRRDDSTPNRSSNMEQAEGSRETVRGSERGGGITNRPLDREVSEQEQLPERGRSRSDSMSDSDRGPDSER